jgi:hypothetical protein
VGVEGVGGCFQQVDVGAGQMINQMQVGYLVRGYSSVGDGQRIFAVLLGLEVQRYLGLVAGVGDGIFRLSYRDVDVCIL